MQVDLDTKYELRSETQVEATKTAAQRCLAGAPGTAAGLRRPGGSGPAQRRRYAAAWLPCVRVRWCSNYPLYHHAYHDHVSSCMH